MPKTPFAYSTLVWYDDEHISPSLEKLALYLKSEGHSPAYYWENTVTAHFDDDTTEEVSIRDFIRENEVDLVAIGEQLDRDIERDKQAYQAWREANPNIGPVTGSPYLFNLPREQLMPDRVEQARYSWK